MLDRCGLPVLICVLPLTQWTVLRSCCYSKALAYHPSWLTCLKTSTPTQWAQLDGAFSDWFFFAVESGKVALLHLLCSSSSSHLTGLFIVRTKEASLGRRLAQRLIYRSWLCWRRRPSCRNARGSSAGCGRTEGRSPSFGSWSKLAEYKYPGHHWHKHCFVISSFIRHGCCGIVRLPWLWNSQYW